jgi:hypothetical protein
MAPVHKMGTRKVPGYVPLDTRNVYGPCSQDWYKECIRPLFPRWVRGMYTAPLFPRWVREVYMAPVPKMGTRKVQTAMSPRWCDRNMKTVKYDFSQRAYTAPTLMIIICLWYTRKSLIKLQNCNYKLTSLYTFL